MDISIVIPVYNGEETLKLCLDAITAMTVPDGMNVEIILVNDGSTDKTKDIVSQYSGVQIINLEK
ncbi:MAG: glycosyltransferase, partial [Candidatus Delongbacteria bacterium]|nr:glycosyltransferase [Candidatus Delongbacteria bacterium]